MTEPMKKSRQKMTSTKTFTPQEPEKKVSVHITEREAVLLSKLRKFPYGKILVHKAEGIIIRIEATNSLLVEADKNQIDLE